MTCIGTVGPDVPVCRGHKDRLDPALTAMIADGTTDMINARWE